MKFKEKVKEIIISRVTEGLAISVSILVIWVASVVGPALMPAIELSLSKSLLVSLLMASLVLNIVFLGLFRVFQKKIDFRLKYGIYWDSDKNPQRRAVALCVAKAIIAATNPNKIMRALEVGCGTGLVSMEIAPLLKSLLAVDTSIPL